MCWYIYPFCKPEVLPTVKSPSMTATTHLKMCIDLTTKTDLHAPTGGLEVAKLVDQVFRTLLQFLSAFSLDEYLTNPYPFSIAVYYKKERQHAQVIGILRQIMSRVLYNMIYTDMCV